jgi:hypothetical protein
VFADFFVILFVAPHLGDYALDAVPTVSTSSRVSVEVAR